jgi:hypothetical protein
MTDNRQQESVMQDPNCVQIPLPDNDQLPTPKPISCPDFITLLREQGFSVTPLPVQPPSYNQVAPAPTVVLFAAPKKPTGLLSKMFGALGIHVNLTIRFES